MDTKTNKSSLILVVVVFFILFIEICGSNPCGKKPYNITGYYYDDFSNIAYTNLYWNDLNITTNITDLCSSVTGKYAMMLFSDGGKCPRIASTKNFIIQGFTIVSFSFFIRTGYGICEGDDEGEGITVFLDTPEKSFEIIDIGNYMYEWTKISKTHILNSTSFSLKLKQKSCVSFIDLFVIDEFILNYTNPIIRECSGKGICNSSNTCDCVEQYRGSICEICPKVCQNNGICYFGDVFINKCSCTMNYTGPSCEYLKRCVHLGKCSNHGICNDYICNCNKGWDINKHCNQSHVCDSLNNSSPFVCRGHGVCVASDKCECIYNYTGSRCQYYKFCPSRNECSNHGFCEEGVDPRKCECYNNYLGKNCSVSTCEGIYSNETTVCNSTGECVSFENCVFCRKIGDGKKIRFYDEFSNFTQTLENWVKGKIITTDECTVYTGSKALFITSENLNCPRFAETKNFSVYSPTNVTVSFRLRNNIGICEGADRKDEGIFVYINLKNGSKKLIVSPVFYQNSWEPLYNYTVSVQSDFSVSFVQEECSGPSEDYYVVDEFSVKYELFSVCSKKGSCNGQVCQCDMTANGTFCEICGLDCGKYGACKDEENYYKCQCDFNHTGPLCRYDLNCTHWDRCSSHGKCNDYTCDCDKGWTKSPFCNESYVCFGSDNSDSNVCYGKGICVFDNNCSCSINFTGSKCQYYKTCEERFNCHGYGKCLSTIHPRVCECEKNYYGENCSVTTCSGILSNDSKVCFGKQKCWPYNNCLKCVEKTDPAYPMIEFFDDFETPSLTKENWLPKYGYITTACNYFSSKHAFRIQSPSGTCPRKAVTRKFSVDQPTDVRIYFHLVSGSGVCDAAEKSEGVVVYVDTESDGSYVVFRSSSDLSRQSNWNYVYEGKSPMINSDFSVRFEQNECDGFLYDHFVIDDVKIKYRHTTGIVEKCYGNGTCDVGKCNCKSGFTGEFCLDCHKDCGDNGYCEFGESLEVICSCENGYSGDTCNKKPCYHLSECNGNGKCNYKGGVPGKCECNTGWAGNDCSVDIIATTIGTGLAIGTILLAIAGAIISFFFLLFLVSICSFCCGCIILCCIGGTGAGFGICRKNRKKKNAEKEGEGEEHELDSIDVSSSDDDDSDDSSSSEGEDSDSDDLPPNPPVQGVDGSSELIIDPNIDGYNAGSDGLDTPPNLNVEEEQRIDPNEMNFMPPIAYQSKVDSSAIEEPDSSKIPDFDVNISLNINLENPVLDEIPSPVFMEKNTLENEEKETVNEKDEREESESKSSEDGSSGSSGDEDSEVEKEETEDESDS